MSAAPWHAVWEITLKCDLACRHCGSRAGKARTQELDTTEALDLVRQLAELGVREVSLIGGEAYLREDWDLIAAAIVDHGMVCTMVTGGRAFTAERARRAAQAGVRSVSFSMDGLAAAHDRQRGVNGSFEAANLAARRLADAGVGVTVNTQINRLSWPDLPAILDLCAQGGFYAWQCQMTVPMGRAADRVPWLMQPDDLLDIMPLLARLAAEGRERGVTLYPGNNVGYFGPHAGDLRGAIPDGAEHYDGCHAGEAVLGIEADGAIKGCPSLPTGPYTGGNIRERSLREIREQAPELTFNTDRSVQLWGACASCYYADICRGGCTWTAHVFFEKPGNNPYCHHRALEFDARGERERFSLAAPAPGRPFDFGRFTLQTLPARTQAARETERRRVRDFVLGARP